MGNIQNTIQDFNLNLEKNEQINEFVTDAFEGDDEEIMDKDVDDLIDRTEERVGGNKVNKNVNQDLDIDAMMGDLKK